MQLGMEAAGTRADSDEALRRGLTWVVGLVALACVVLGVRLSLGRAYAVDEFAYAHAGWLIAQGAIPTVDFFETKFHGPLWVFSTVFLAGGDDPHLIRALRLLIWPFVGVIVLATGLASRRLHPLAMAGTALALLANPVFLNTALEIRPDVVALACLLGGIALLGPGSSSPGRAFAAGALLGLCLWSTAKAAIYGSPLALLWLHDATRRDPAARIGFGRPVVSLAGLATVGAGVLAYLLATGALASFISQAIDHNRQFLVGQRWRPWQLDPVFLATQVPWVHALAAVGLGTTLARRLQRGRFATALDPLWLALLATTFLSHALQRYPFLYSLLPFMAIEAIFAGRGLLALTEAALAAAGAMRRGTASFVGVWTGVVVGGAAGLLLVAGLWNGIGILATLGQPTNGAQHAVLEEIAALTSPGDPIYDNSGSYVARPNAYFLPWTDAPIRARWGAKLVEEVPLAIDRSDCVVALVDDRFHSLPEPLKAWIGRHFTPHRGPILLWGRDYAPDGGRVEDVFLANRAGHYRVMPAELVEGARLEIGGRPIESPVFALEEGEHALVYDGPHAGFRLQWAPTPPVSAAGPDAR